MAEFVFKIYENGEFKVYSDDITSKIYDLIETQSCLKNFLQTIYSKLSEIDESFVYLSNQDKAYPIITIQVNSQEYDKYIPFYTFNIILHDKIEGILEYSEAIEEGIDEIICVHRVNEIGPRYYGNENIFEHIFDYKWICGVSNG